MVASPGASGRMADRTAPQTQANYLPSTQALLHKKMPITLNRFVIVVHLTKYCSRSQLKAIFRHPFILHRSVLRALQNDILVRRRLSITHKNHLQYVDRIDQSRAAR